jgi:hypothetical protein
LRHFFQFTHGENSGPGNRPPVRYHSSSATKNWSFGLHHAKSNFSKAQPNYVLSDRKSPDVAIYLKIIRSIRSGVTRITIVNHLIITASIFIEQLRTFTISTQICQFFWH